MAAVVDFTGWVGRMRQAVCSHATVVWASEAYSYDSARHRRTRWRSTVTGRCVECGLAFVKGPAAEAKEATVRIHPGLMVDLDITLLHAVNVLEERLQQAADEERDPELLALSKKIRSLYPRLQGVRIIREGA